MLFTVIVLIWTYIFIVIIHYMRNVFNTFLPNNETEAIKRGYYSKNPKYHQNHQIGGPNLKYTNGRKEVVFYAGGNRVNNTPEDLGTYNYWISKDQDTGFNKTMHRLLDVYPYILFGNSFKDKTTLKERLKILG